MWSLRWAKIKLKAQKATCVLNIRKLFHILFYLKKCLTHCTIHSINQKKVKVLMHFPVRELSLSFQFCFFYKYSSTFTEPERFGGWRSGEKDGRAALGSLFTHRNSQKRNPYQRTEMVTRNILFQNLRLLRGFPDMMQAPCTTDTKEDGSLSAHRMLPRLCTTSASLW